MKRIGIGAIGVFAAAMVASPTTHAGGIPASQPLAYSGLLEEGSVPVDGTRSIGLSVWKVASGGTAVCSVAAANVTVTAGRFRIPLSDSCTVAVHQNRDLWIEVLVGGASLGRSKLGAVPYAVEAGPYVNRTTGSQYSANAAYCGSADFTSGAVTSGSDTGWVATKKLCEAACSSPTAHMCTSEEVVRHLATGGETLAGWYSTGVSTPVAFDVSDSADDCLGWISASSVVYGSRWNGGSPMYVSCDSTPHMLCCD